MRSSEGLRGAVLSNELLSRQKGSPVASQAPCSNLSSIQSVVMVTTLSDFFERLMAPRSNFAARPLGVASYSLMRLAPVGADPVFPSEGASEVKGLTCL